jgi:xanthine phosphoribosyltransferase
MSDYRLATTQTLTWSRIHRDCQSLAARLADQGPFRGIVAVARGGLVPAALLAQMLDIRLVDTVCVISYADRRQDGIEVVKTLPGDGAGWLVVDDLVDSGATAQVVRSLLPRAHYATLYAKPDGLPQVDTFVAAVDQHVWLVFPWEAAADEVS